MTKEPIMIDNVDVDECGELVKQDENTLICITGYLCKDRHNCYYKQLKRKEQACEMLKEEIKHYKQIAQHHGDLSVKYTNKSAKLKQALQEIKEIAEKDCETCTVKLLGEDEINCKRCYKTKILQKISEVIE